MVRSMSSAVSRGGPSLHEPARDPRQHLLQDHQPERPPRRRHAPRAVRDLGGGDPVEDVGLIERELKWFDGRSVGKSGQEEDRPQRRRTSRPAGEQLGDSMRPAHSALGRSSRSPSSRSPSTTASSCPRGPGRTFTVRRNGTTSLVAEPDQGDLVARAAYGRAPPGAARSSSCPRREAPTSTTPASPTSSEAPWIGSIQGWAPSVIPTRYSTRNSGGISLGCSRTCRSRAARTGPVAPPASRQPGSGESHTRNGRNRLGRPQQVVRGGGGIGGSALAGTSAPPAADRSCAAWCSARPRRRAATASRYGAVPVEPGKRLERATGRRRPSRSTASPN